MRYGAITQERGNILTPSALLAYICRTSSMRIVSVTITDSRETEIEDAIRSVVDHVDQVLVLDTGVKDRTIEIAREVAKDKLVVAHHQWVDFSTARNAGLDAAKELGADWIVIIDTDERLNLGQVDLRKELARASTEILFIDSNDGHYPKEKILRADSSARFVGPTHEALDGGSRATLYGAVFYELGKTHEQCVQKFTRDVKLLREHLSKHGNDPRWWYYLGQSLEGLGQGEQAAEAFGICVAKRRVGDEAAWAAYKQAEQLHKLDRHEEAIAAAARGLGADATYAECAWIAAVSAYRLNRTSQAIAWARIAEAIGRYKGCGRERAFFRHQPALYELPYDVLRYALPDEAGRTQAEADFRAAKLARIGAPGPEDLDRFSVSRSTPAHGLYEARSMLRPPRLATICPSMSAVRIRFEPPGGRRPMNPSITWHDGELWCVVRAVNYSITGRQYTIDDADGIVRTENYLGRLLPDGEFVDPKPMLDLDPSPRRESRIVGYEDVRLVSIDGSDSAVLTASATVCDRDPNRRLIARLYLDEDGNVRRAIVQPSNQLHEKNWMPLSVNGEFTWIYSLDPTCILPGPLRSCPFALEHLRGGAAICFDDGYLCVAHEAIDTDEDRIYLHRFVRLDGKWNVVAVSPAWIFADYGIEFCPGLVLDGDELVLSYGIKDQEAWVARVDVKEVEEMEWITP